MHPDAVFDALVNADGFPETEKAALGQDSANGPPASPGLSSESLAPKRTGLDEYGSTDHTLSIAKAGVVSWSGP